MTRVSSDEHYVIDCATECWDGRRADSTPLNFLTGDPGGTGRRGKRLPVDAYYEDISLVVEFMESQHSVATPFFDKPDKLTVSGVHRGEQRRLYDERRRQVLPAHGITLITFDAQCSARPAGRERSCATAHDEGIVRERLADFL